MSTRSFPWWIVGVLVGLSPLVGLLGWFSATVQYRQDPPSCYGIGWGYEA